MSRETPALLAGFAVLAALVATLAGRDLGTPGLYYDEVIQAEPAVQFLRDDGSPVEIPGATATRLFGGWFPVRTQPYMGAPKSQLLIPVFSIFGASARTLRAATLALGIAGLGLTLLFARRLLGPAAALVAGALLALDPSFLFVARHDWGSFALGLVCRTGGLWLVLVGARHARAGPAAAALFAAGALFGLGVYNKIDFGVFLAASAASLAIAAPRAALRVARERPAALVAGALGLALGAAPVLATAPDVLAATRASARTQTLDSDDWGEKRAVLEHALDGTYIDRLVRAGGSFDAMHAVGGVAATPLPQILAAAALVLAVGLSRGRSGERGAAHLFLLGVLALTLLGIFFTPRAVRVHHALNVHPFPHLVVAAAALAVWRRGGDASSPAARAAWRALPVAALAFLLAANVRADLRTFETLSAGGKGRWSDALAQFARELESRPGDVAVSLDWGFDLPLRFAARDLARTEPVWRLSRLPPRARELTGTPQHVYLVWPDDLAVFEFGGALLDAARALPDDRVEIRRHEDRDGDLAFYSIRFSRSHRISWRAGRAEVTFTR